MKATLTAPDGVLCPGELYQVTATGQQNPIISFEWKMLTGPAGGNVTFSGQTQGQADFSVNVPGVYQLQYCYYTEAG